MTWKKVAEKNTIAPNRGEEFDIGGKKIAIFNNDVYPIVSFFNWICLKLHTFQIILEFTCFDIVMPEM